MDAYNSTRGAAYVLPLYVICYSCFQTGGGRTTRVPCSILKAKRINMGLYERNMIVGAPTFLLSKSCCGGAPRLAVRMYHVSGDAHAVHGVMD